MDGEKAKEKRDDGEEEQWNEEQVVQVDDAAADNVGIPTLRIQINMAEPATSSNFESYGGSVEKAQEDARYQQMEREIARYH